MKLIGNFVIQDMTKSIIGKFLVDISFPLFFLYLQLE